MRSGTRWRMSHAVTLRIARLTLSKTKEEVKEIVRKMDDHS